jgi:flavin-dependent dehydrogenase
VAFVVPILLLGRQLSIMDVHDDLKNVACWSYYQGCKRYEGDAAGHTLIENLLDGWLWYIPVGQGVTSVGFVTPGSLAKRANISIEEILEARIASSSEVKRMMEGSTRVSAYRTERDWSYTCRRFHGPGWALVGDASAFIDPLLSTGVALAVRGARILSDALRVALDDPRREAVALAAYEKNQRAFLSVILEFVRYFYDGTRTRAEYHMGAQDLVDPSQEQEPEFDFVQLVSGLALDDKLDIPEAVPAISASAQL